MNRARDVVGFDLRDITLDATFSAVIRRLLAAHCRALDDADEFPVRRATDNPCSTLRGIVGKAER